jgi:hypothetical protein
MKIKRKKDGDRFSLTSPITLTDQTHPCRRGDYNRTVGLFTVFLLGLRRDTAIAGLAAARVRDQHCMKTRG